MFENNSILINLKKQLKEKNKFIKLKIDINKHQCLIVKDFCGNEYSQCKCCDVIVFPGENCFVDLDDTGKIFHPRSFFEDNNFSVVVRVILKSGIKYAYILSCEHICLPILSVDEEISHGDIVLAKLGLLDGERFNRSKKQYFCFVRKLVSYLDPNLKIKTYLISKNLPIKNPFEMEYIKDGKYLVRNNEKDLYLDLRYLNFFTIDSYNSNALDDAIAIEVINNKQYKVYIAITDVDSILKENTVIDNYAKSIGYSIYTPGFVVQMLPSSIAYREASLISGFDRKALVVSCIVDSLSHKIVSNTLKIKYATINVKCRFSFDDINRILIDNDENIVSFISNGLIDKDNLKKLQAFSSGLNANSLINGRLVHNHYKYLCFFSSTYDNIVGVSANFKDLAQTIVESIMVWVNYSLSEFAKNNIKKYPFIFVNHQAILKKSIKKLRTKLLDIGLLFSIEDFDKIETFNIIASELIKKGFDSYYNNLLFRLLPKTNLSYEPKNHFSLGLESYSTWTSPIRKYTDLWNLRRLKELLFGLEFKGEPLNLEQLENRRGEFRKLTLEAEKITVSNLLLSKIQKNKKLFSGKIVHYSKTGIIVEIYNIGLIGLLSIKQITYKTGLLYDEAVNKFYDKNYREFSLIGKFIILEATDSLVGYNMVRINYVAGII